MKSWHLGAVATAICACILALPASCTKRAPVRFGTPTVPTTYQFVTPALTDADHGLLVTGSGHIYQIHCVLQQLTDAAADAGGSTPLYVMTFDTSSSSQPVQDAAPLAGGVSGGLSAIGNDVLFSDEETPFAGAISFSNGLLLAVSTTPDVFTPPAAGNIVRCDAKLRQMP